MMPASFKIPMERYGAKRTRFASEARQLPPIGANTAGQDALQQTALAFAAIAKLKSARSLS
jgi:hypothetical protein